MLSSPRVSQLVKILGMDRFWEGILTSAGLRLSEAGVACVLANKTKAKPARMLLNCIFLVVRGGVQPCALD